jgi:hypothetical protein
MPGLDWNLDSLSMRFLKKFTGFSLFFAKAKEVVGKRDPAHLVDYKKGITSGPERLPKSIMI